MSDLNALLPCPFCGEGQFARVERYQFPPDDEGPAWKWGYHVICDASGISGTHRGCGGASAWGETEVEAIAAWNRRAIPSTGSGETAAARDVLAERKRQVEAEGFDYKHDDRHQHGELVYAAAAYALAARSGFGASWQRGIIERLWPWDPEWWKPKKPRDNLVKAASLLIADIERLDRAAPANPVETQAVEVGE